MKRLADEVAKEYDLLRSAESAQVQGERLRVVVVGYVWRDHWRVLCVLWSRSGLSLCSLLLHDHTGHYYEKEGAGLPGTLFFTNVRSQFWDSYSGSLSLLLPRATDG